MQVTPSMRDVAVIVPAHDAETTVGRAVASALRDPRVAEVVVVDDASADATSRAARAADDGSGRLTVISLPRNGGPAAARNAGIQRSNAPLLALLDADDMYRTGRLEKLTAVSDWDIVADDVAFTASPVEQATLADVPMEPVEESRLLTLSEFAASNVTRRGRQRRELGFLHPVMRRSFLDAHGLVYDETMRLGEDYDLYARALLAGARFRLAAAVGYVALERPDSLSGSHRTEDLARLRLADVRLLSHPNLGRTERRAVLRHLADTERRYALRRVLDIRRSEGLDAAFAWLAGHPRRAPAIALDISRDKWIALARRLGRTANDRPRTLFTAR